MRKIFKKQRNQRDYIFIVICILKYFKYSFISNKQKKLLKIIIINIFFYFNIKLKLDKCADLYVFVCIQKKFETVEHSSMGTFQILMVSN